MLFYCTLGLLLFRDFIIKIPIHLIFIRCFYLILCIQLYLVYSVE